MAGFLKLTASEENIIWWAKKRPTAFFLLMIIAKRAKRSEDHPDKTLAIGEAYIGDFKSYGATEQIYRSDKKYLISNGQITIRVTNKGTIAKIDSSTLFDVNGSATNEPINTKSTEDQRTTNGQPTTNKNDKIVRKEEEKNMSTYSKREAEEILSYFNQKFEKNFKDTTTWIDNFRFWKAAGYDLDNMKAAIDNARLDEFWSDKFTPTMLFRTRDTAGQKIDRIGDLMNKKQKKKMLRFDRMEL